MSVSLTQYLEAQREWSERTFGSDMRTFGITSHIEKELQEIRTNPCDLMEWIDVIILALDGYWRHGGRPERIMQMLCEKQYENARRKWPKPTSENEAVEHIR